MLARPSLYLENIKHYGLECLFSMSYPDELMPYEYEFSIRDTKRVFYTYLPYVDTFTYKYIIKMYICLTKINCKMKHSGIAHFSWTIFPVKRNQRTKWDNNVIINSRRRVRTRRNGSMYVTAVL